MPHTAPGGPLQYHGPWKGVGLLVGPTPSVFWLTHTHPRPNRLSHKTTKWNKTYLSTMDLLVLATMKNAAKRDM